MDLKTENVQLILDYCTDLIVHFPDNSEFLKADMVSGEPEGLKQVEQGK